MKFGTFATVALAASLPVLVAAKSPAPSGLLALYTFNGTLHDSSGHGKTAIDSGKPTYVNGAPFGGKAIAFDGSGKAVVTAPLDISVAALPQVTFGAWVMADSVRTPQYGVISNDNGGYDRTIDIDARSATTGANWSAFIGTSVVGKVPAVPGKWVFAAVSYDQSTLPGTYAFYVNDGSHTTVLHGPAGFDGDSVTKAVTIGRNPNFDQPFNGKIANAFFYRGILTLDQINAIVARGPSMIPGHMTQKEAAVTYRVTYGAKDLGMWSTLAIGKNASGTYDGTNFDATSGPGFRTVALSRSLTATNRRGLWSSLPAPNVTLVVRASKNGKILSATTCPKAQASDFSSSGDPGSGSEVITFACTSVSTTK